MELSPTQMGQYAQFLEEHSRQILQLCQNMEQLTAMASQCMDQKTGLVAARDLLANMETIKKNIPMSDDACHRLILTMKQVAAIGDSFGGRGR